MKNDNLKQEQQCAIHDVMNNKKNRIIPNVPKDERISFDVGYHQLPNWLLISFVIIVFVGIVCWLYCS